MSTKYIYEGSKYTKKGRGSGNTMYMQVLESTALNVKFIYVLESVRLGTDINIHELHVTDFINELDTGWKQIN